MCTPTSTLTSHVDSDVDQPRQCAHRPTRQLPRRTRHQQRFDGSCLNRHHVDGSSLDGHHINGGCLDGHHVDSGCLDGHHIDGSCLDDHPCRQMPGCPPPAATRQCDLHP